MPAVAIDSLQRFPVANFDRILGVVLSAEASARVRKEDITSTFYGQSIAAIQKMQDASDPDEIEKQINGIENAVLESIRRTPRIRISFEAWINIILAIVLFMYNAISTEKFQTAMEQKTDVIEHLENKISGSQQKMYDALSEYMQEHDKSGTYYVVVRKAILRLKPSTKSPAVSVTFPNQKVNLEKRKGKWIYVTFFDYVDGVTRSGWVLKKYLKIIRE